ncbi:MAG: PEGA domain-containing protein [Myxococcota bacterium]|nr:PEGA domain-containing protein [Myxococcota bacterium]
MRDRIFFVQQPRGAAWPAAAIIAALAAVSADWAAAQAPAHAVPAFAVAAASDPNAESSLPALQQAGLQVLGSTAPFVTDQVVARAFGADARLGAQVQVVQTALAAGLQGLAGLDLDTATMRFQEVVAAFEDNPVLTGVAGTEPLARALVSLGTLAYLNGDELGCEEHFRTAHIMNPQVLPDADLFPDVVDVHNRIAREMRGLAAGTLLVEAVPGGAEVWVDGVPRGPAPVRLDVPPGRHVVAARAFGYAPGGAFVQVRARRTERAPISLSPLPGVGEAATAVAGLSSALLEGAGREIALLRSIADAVGARIVLLLWIMPNDGRSAMVSIQMYDRVQDRIVATSLSPELALNPATMGSATTASMAQCIAGPAQDLMRVAVAPPPPPPPPPWNGDVAPPDDDDDDDDEGSILGAWWFWTAIGAVVAGGAGTGLYFGLRSTGPSGSDRPELILEF